MNPEYWLGRVDSEPDRALSKLKSMGSVAQPVVSQLADKLSMSSPILSMSIAETVVAIGPESDRDIKKLLAFLMELGPRGCMLPTAVRTLEMIAWRSAESLEYLAQALRFPHYRVQLAGARALSPHASLAELIIDAIRCASESPHPEVRATLRSSLNPVIDSLPSDLKDQLEKIDLVPLGGVPAEKRDYLEQVIWVPTASALNGISGDEDAIFDLRYLTEAERSVGLPDSLDVIGNGLGIPSMAQSLHEASPDKLSIFLRFVLESPVGSRCLSDERVAELASLFAGFFNPPVRIFSNFQPFPDGRGAGLVSVLRGATIEAGVVVVDQERVGVFWVTDED